MNNTTAIVPGTVTAKCRGCGRPLSHVVVDLGLSPIANDFPMPEQLTDKERIYPLKVFACEHCYLVQIEEFEAPDTIFNAEYAYFSSFSESWVKHARDYVEMMIKRFGFGPTSLVVEIASNDGYLLQWFHKAGVPVLGIEPSANTAKVAEEKGIKSITEFFGVKLAKELVARGTSGDLILGNNVLAHVPDVHDFIAGMKIALKPGGIITMEFPHFLELVRKNQFDTIYHEHFSYFSFISVEKLFAKEGLTIFDVERLPTHGGSLRIFARHSEAASPSTTARPSELRQEELQAKLDNHETYRAFWDRVKATKAKLVEMLTNLKKSGATIAAYGAPAKGNTLLNYCGIGTSLIDFTVDRSTFKQGRLLPGSHIPICSPDKLREARPDYIVILPWNLQEEIVQQIGYVREWGCQFIVPIPEPRIVR